ncbi:MAG: MFS transporter [Gammaproteobacteria bacterium]|nr:MFS transporter [Gammaproteobacteria bacterium]
MQKRAKFQPWIVCITAAFYFFYIFIQMTKFNAIGHDLMLDFRISSTGLGTLSSIYFWGNLLFFFPAGLMLDRFSSKKILLTAMSVTIICTYLFSFTNSVFQASWCFLFLGLAGSFGLLLPLRLVTRWFPPEKMAFASGICITIGFFGAMVSQSPLTILVNHVGWRTGMQIDAFLGIILLILMAVLVKDFPQGVTREITHEQATSITFLLHSLKKSIGNLQNWMFGTYTCLVNLPIFVLGAVFGVRYLEQTYNLSEEQASFATLLMFLGAMVGSPLFGWLSDSMRKRKPLMYWGAFISLALIFILMYSSNLCYLTIYVLFFAIGIFTSSQVITYPVIAESNPGEFISTSMGMGSMLIMSGGAIFVPLFGTLLDLNWHGKLFHGVPVHSVADYRLALWMFPIAFFVAIITLLVGKETHCKTLGSKS